MQRPETGPGVTGVAVDDEVIGFAKNRPSHAEYVLVEAPNLTSKPAEVHGRSQAHFSSAAARLPPRRYPKADSDSRCCPAAPPAD